MTWSNHRIRGSGSPESLCEFGSFVPVRALVEAPPAPSRWDVKRKLGTKRAERKELKTN